MDQSLFMSRPWSPTGDAPKGNGDVEARNVTATTDPVANGRCAERQWRHEEGPTSAIRVAESPTGDAPKGNGDSTKVTIRLWYELCRQRAMRRKAMETATGADSVTNGLAVANGRCAERQWRHECECHISKFDFLSPTGDAPKGNGD